MEIPGIAVIAVIAVIAAIGIGAFMVMRDSPSDREDRGPYSSGIETTGSFAVFGTTPDDSGSDGGGSDDGGSDDGGGGDGRGGD